MRGQSKSEAEFRFLVILRDRIRRRFKVTDHACESTVKIVSVRCAFAETEAFALYAPPLRAGERLNVCTVVGELRFEANFAKPVSQLSDCLRSGDTFPARHRKPVRKCSSFDHERCHALED